MRFLPARTDGSEKDLRVRPVRDSHAAVLSEGPRGDLDPRRRLAPLVLAPVDEGHAAANDFFGEPRRDHPGDALILLNHPPVRPCGVAYPTLISLLFPVVSTRWPNLLERAMRIMPRIRAWMFSSVVSAGVLPHGSAGVGPRRRKIP